MLASEIIQVATALTSLCTLIVAVVNVFKIEIIHKATNSMKDELVAAVRSSAHAKGMVEGKAEEKTEEKERRNAT